MTSPSVEKVRLRLTGLGAVLGAVVAFVAVGALEETLWVILGAAIGWVVGLIVSVLVRRWREDERIAVETDHLRRQHTHDELYEKAERLDIDGRSDMNKQQLAEAVARHDS